MVEISNDSPLTEAAGIPAKEPLRLRYASDGRAFQSLRAAAVLGVLSKALGVLIVPGMRGVVAQHPLEIAELISGITSYLFAGALLVAIGSSGIALARTRKPEAAKTAATVTVIHGLVMALSSGAFVLVVPAFAQRLQLAPALALDVVASLSAGLAACLTVRVARTRALGVLLLLLSLSGALRALVWAVPSIYNALALTHEPFPRVHAVVGIRALAVALQASAALLASVWLGTRSPWRGRLLTNVAILAAFGVTYLGARTGIEASSDIEAILRASLALASGPFLPFGLSNLAVFLVPAFTLFALVALLQRAPGPRILAPFALALLSQGMFDVPLQALAILAASHGALLVAREPEWFS